MEEITQIGKEGETMQVHYLEIVTQEVDAAVATAVQAGGEIAHPPMEIPGHGKFAIFIRGGNHHGLWQL